MQEKYAKEKADWKTYRKMASVSDIVVYGERTTKKDVILKLAQKLSEAQINWRIKSSSVDDAQDALVFNTFVLSSKYHDMLLEVLQDFDAKIYLSTVRGD